MGIARYGSALLQIKALVSGFSSQHFFSLHKTRSTMYTILSMRMMF